VEFATPLSHDEERIDACYDGEPLRYRMMEDILSDQPVPRLVSHDLDEQLHLACDDGEPQSFTEAEKDDPQPFWSKREDVSQFNAELRKEGISKGGSLHSASSLAHGHGSSAKPRAPRA
jgi:hypothetical protein